MFDKLSSNASKRVAPIRRIGFSEAERLEITVLCIELGLVPVFVEAE